MWGMLRCMENSHVLIVVLFNLKDEQLYYNINTYLLQSVELQGSTLDAKHSGVLLPCVSCTAWVWDTENELKLKFCHTHCVSTADAEFEAAPKNKWNLTNLMVCIYFTVGGTTAQRILSAALCLSRNRNPQQPPKANDFLPFFPKFNLSSDFFFFPLMLLTATMLVHSLLNQGSRWSCNKQSSLASICSDFSFRYFRVFSMLCFLPPLEDDIC